MFETPSLMSVFAVQFYILNFYINIDRIRIFIMFTMIYANFQNISYSFDIRFEFYKKLIYTILFVLFLL